MPGSNALDEVSALVVALEPVPKVAFVSNLVAALKTAVVVKRGYVVEYANLLDGENAGREEEPGGVLSAADTTAAPADGTTGTGPSTAEIVVRVREAQPPNS